MIRLEIRPPGQPSNFFDVSPGVYAIGSDQDCPICLGNKDIAPRHAILSVRDDSYSIDDLDSPAGTFVSGKKVNGYSDLGPGEPITLGPFTILIHTEHKESAPSERTATKIYPEPEPAAAAQAKPQPKLETLADIAAAAKDAPSGARAKAPALAPDPQAEQLRSIRQQIHKELVERMDIKRLAASRVDRAEVTKKAKETIQAIVADVKGRLPPGIEPARLAQDVYNEALGLGPLEDFLADPEITEVMVNGHNQIYIEKNGRLVRTQQTFMDDTSVLAVIERIVSPLGRRIDESQPYVDARLPDGSRVNAIIHPLSLIGPCLTIRKFSKTPFTDTDLIGFGTMPRYIAEFVDICVQLRKNIVISGGTGSGKTTLLNVFSSYLPESDRIITIEDAAELRLTQTHIVRLEARPPNIEGRGAVAIRDLVRNALRMRPDRIVVGECRGGEALDMLQAMNTGHDGSLTTVHANSPRDVISRLETMVLMSGMDLPIRAIREQIASAIDVVVHEARFSDGSRKVTRVTEIVGLEGDQVTMQDIFEFNQTGVDEKGGVLGAFRATGSVPTFVEEIASRGLTIDRTMFDPNAAGKA